MSEMVWCHFGGDTYGLLDDTYVAFVGWRISWLKWKYKIGTEEWCDESFDTIEEAKAMAVAYYRMNQ